MAIFVRQVLLLALTVSVIGPGGTADAKPQCKFTSRSSKTAVDGNSKALIKNGYVKTQSNSLYDTDFTVDVGIWIDQELARLDPNMPRLVLAYFEHANCIFAQGDNPKELGDVHRMSLRIANRRLRYYTHTTPKAKQSTKYWIQQTHYDWHQAIKQLGKKAPKVNVLFSARSYVDTDDAPGTKTPKWDDVLGTSNGVGQGQAIVSINPSDYKNTSSNRYNFDWWGVITAHELGHALGKGGHLKKKFFANCCGSGVSYSTREIGRTPSRKFAISPDSWAAISKNNATRTDDYADPYAKIRNPETNITWSYPQISRFLKVSTDRKRRIWRYTGKPCSKGKCRGWEALDLNPKTRELALGSKKLYQRHVEGPIWQYTSKPCQGSRCRGWKKLDKNYRTEKIVAGDRLYQLHSNGTILEYTGTPCAKKKCDGWRKLDQNPNTLTIEASQKKLYQLHRNGSIWRYTGSPCKKGQCPGWQQIEKASATVALAAANTLYKLHKDGSIWRYTGKPCGSKGCSGWQKIGGSSTAKMIAAHENEIYALGSTGKVRKYTGQPCTKTGCKGWALLDNNSKTISIAAGNSLYQLHRDGAIWEHTGQPCTQSGCPGWRKLDNNKRTSSIYAHGDALYQMH